MYKIQLSPYAKVFYNDWLLSPTGNFYNLVIDQVLCGDLNAERLKDALRRYIAEHVVFNSHIQTVNGEPHWVQNRNIVDLEYFDSPISMPRLFAYVNAAFDLHNDPLYRFRLIRLNDKEHRFIVVLHHIITDGSSVTAGVYQAISNYYNDNAYTTKYDCTTQVKLLANLADKLSSKLEQHRERYKKFWHDQLSNIDINYSYYPIADIIQEGNKSLLNVSFIQTNLRDVQFEFDGIESVNIRTDLHVDAISEDTLLFEQELRDKQLNYRIRYDKRSFNKTLVDSFVCAYKSLFVELLEHLLAQNNSLQNLEELK